MTSAANRRPPPRPPGGSAHSPFAPRSSARGPPGAAVRFQACSATRGRRRHLPADAEGTHQRERRPRGLQFSLAHGPHGGADQRRRHVHVAAPAASGWSVGPQLLSMDTALFIFIFQILFPSWFTPRLFHISHFPPTLELPRSSLEKDVAIPPTQQGL